MSSSLFFQLEIQEITLRRYDLFRLWAKVSFLFICLPLLKAHDGTIKMCICVDIFDIHILPFICVKSYIMSIQPTKFQLKQTNNKFMILHYSASDFISNLNLNLIVDLDSQQLI